MLQAGIVGLPNVGKSTLFNALTKSRKAEAANFPFCTIDPNVGIVNVPDEKLAKLSKLSQSLKIIPAILELVDIAGIVKGASEGAGLGNQFLSHIREVAALVQVLRCFEDENVHHVDGSVHALRDAETIHLELLLADLTVMQKRLPRLEKGLKTAEKEIVQEHELLKRLIPSYEAAQVIQLELEEKQLLKHLSLLTLKPLIYAANLKEDELEHPEKNENYLKLVEKFGQNKVIPISAQLEAELAGFSTVDAQEYMESVGLKRSGVDELIQAIFALLGLMSYYTTGQQETRAWTIPVGSTAPQAAGAIHTDFERGFIKAEVLSCADFVHYGTKIAAREAGRLRLEGKEYIVKADDVIEFKFNV